MSVLIKLREYRTLPEAENQVRNFILKNSKDVINMTIYELAKSSYTSTATIVRLCKKIDVKGFNKLKIMIASEIKSFDDLHFDILDTTSIHKDETTHEIIEKITNITIKSVEETKMLVDEELMIKIAKLMNEAIIIDFYGVGASNIVALDATYKFMRIGKLVASYSLYDRQYVQAVNSTNQHVGVIFSYSGNTKEMVAIAKILQKNNTPFITVTCSTSNQLNKIGDMNLFVSSKETVFRSGAMSSRTSQLFIVDLLYALCCSLDYDNSQISVNKTRISSE